MKWAVIQAEQENDMNVLKKLMQRLCGYGKHDDREHGELLTAQLRLGPADILESDENGIIPEQASEPPRESWRLNSLRKR